MEISEAFAFEISELWLPHGTVRTIGIFHDGSQRGISHHEAAAPTTVEVVRKQAERVGVAVEARHVHPFRFGKFAAIGSNQVVKRAAVSFAEISAYGALAAVAERRVAHIVRQTSRTHYGPHTRKFRVGKFGTPTDKLAAYVSAQRAAHTRHFKTVRQAVVNKHASGKGKHLRFVLHAPEGSRKDKAVVVALKLRAALFKRLLFVFLPQTFGGNEGLPVHGHRTNRFCEKNELGQQSIPIKVLTESIAEGLGQRRSRQMYEKVAAISIFRRNKGGYAPFCVFLHDYGSALHCGKSYHRPCRLTFAPTARQGTP